MTIYITDAQARDMLAELLDQVTLDGVIVVIHRRGKEDVVMTAASEQESLMETVFYCVHLLNAHYNF